MRTKPNAGETIISPEPETNQNEIDLLEDLSIFDEFENPDTAKFISINLHRFKPGSEITKKAFPPFAGSFDVNKPPTLADIKSLYGGGDYMLVVRYKDASKAGGFTLEKKVFSIEGPPAAVDNTTPPVIAPQTNGNGSISSANPANDIISTIKLLKDLGLFPAQNQSTGETSLILQSMKDMHELTIKMIENNKPAANDTEKLLIKTLLEKALEKSGSDLDQFAKYAEIIGNIQGGGGNESETMSLIKALAPQLLPIFLQRKQAPAIMPPGNAPQLQRSVNTRPAAMIPAENPAPAVMQPAGDNTELILNEIRALNKRIDTIEARENLNEDTFKLIESMLDNNQTAEEIYHRLIASNEIQDIEEFNLYLDELNLKPLILENTQDAEIYEITNNQPINNNTDMLGLLTGGVSGFTDKLKTMERPERVQTLKSAAQFFTQEQIYNFCLKNDVVKDLQDFNSYMIEAGLPELQAS